MKTLIEYQSACEDLAIEFYHKFYAKEEARGECFEWLHDFGSFFTLGDQIYTPYEMMEAIRLDVTREQLFDWYYGNMWACCELSRISLAAYLKGDRAHAKR